MKIGQMFESKYLKKEDVGNGLTLTIRDVTVEDVSMEDQPQDNKPVMYFHEMKKGMVINKTNANLVIHYLGTDDTNAWLGQQIVLFDDPTVQFKGEMTGGIRIRPVQLNQQPATQTPAQVPPVSTSAVPAAGGRAAPSQPYNQNPAFDDDIPL